MDPDVFTVREVACRLRVSSSTAYKAVRDGTIPSIRLQGRYIVPRVQFERWLEGRPWVMEGDDGSRSTHANR